MMYKTFVLPGLLLGESHSSLIACLSHLFFAKPGPGRVGNSSGGAGGLHSGAGGEDSGDFIQEFRIP